MNNMRSFFLWCWLAVLVAQAFAASDAHRKHGNGNGPHQNGGVKRRGGGKSDDYGYKQGGGSNEWQPQYNDNPKYDHNEYTTESYEYTTESHDNNYDYNTYNTYNTYQSTCDNTVVTITKTDVQTEYQTKEVKVTETKFDNSVSIQTVTETKVDNQVSVQTVTETETQTEVKTKVDNQLSVKTMTETETMTSTATLTSTETQTSTETLTSTETSVSTDTSTLTKFETKTETETETSIKEKTKFKTKIETMLEVASCKLETISPITIIMTKTLYREGKGDGWGLWNYYAKTATTTVYKTMLKVVTSAHTGGSMMTQVVATCPPPKIVVETAAPTGCEATTSGTTSTEASTGNGLDALPSQTTTSDPNASSQTTTAEQAAITGGADAPVGDVLAQADPNNPDAVAGGLDPLSVSASGTGTPPVLELLTEPGLAARDGHLKGSDKTTSSSESTSTESSKVDKKKGGDYVNNKNDNKSGGWNKSGDTYSSGGDDSGENSYDGNNKYDGNNNYDGNNKYGGNNDYEGGGGWNGWDKTQGGDNYNNDDYQMSDTSTITSTSTTDGSYACPTEITMTITPPCAEVVTMTVMMPSATGSCSNSTGGSPPFSNSTGLDLGSGLGSPDAAFAVGSPEQSSSTTSAAADASITPILGNIAEIPGRDLSVVPVSPTVTSGAANSPAPSDALCFFTNDLAFRPGLALVPKSAAAQLGQQIVAARVTDGRTEYVTMTNMPNGAMPSMGSMTSTTTTTRAAAVKARLPPKPRKQFQRG